MKITLICTQHMMKKKDVCLVYYINTHFMTHRLLPRLWEADHLYKETISCLLHCSNRFYVNFRQKYTWKKNM